nr:hypothetical protein Itr_chr10CG11620 [Ipomoea trifida]
MASGWATIICCCHFAICQFGLLELGTMRQEQMYNLQGAKEVEKANKRQRIENAEAEMRITERLRNPVSIRVDDSERQMVQHVAPQDLALKHDSEHKLGMILMDVLKKLDISLLNGRKPGGECII